MASRRARSEAFREVIPHASSLRAASIFIALLTSISLFLSDFMIHLNSDEFRYGLAHNLLVVAAAAEVGDCSYREDPLQVAPVEDTSIIPRTVINGSLYPPQTADWGMLPASMRSYREHFLRPVEYDSDEPDPWGSSAWVYSEFDLLFDVFSEARVQTYLKLLSEATGYSVSRIVPLRNTVGARGLAYGSQTLFSVRLVDALPKQPEVTWPPGYVPPTTTTPTTMPTTTMRTATTLSTTAVTTKATTTTPPVTVTTSSGDDANTSSADNLTTDTTTLTTTTTTTAATTRTTTTTTRPTTTTTTTRPPRTLASTTVPNTTTATTTSPEATTLPPGVTPVPASPQPFRNSDASLFVNAVRKQLSDLRSPLSRQRLVSIRKVYRAPRTVETIYVGVDYVWVLFVIFGVFVISLSLFLVMRNRPQQQLVVGGTDASGGGQSVFAESNAEEKEMALLNVDDEAIRRRELQETIYRTHKGRVEYAKKEGLPPPLTRGALLRARNSGFDGVTSATDQNTVFLKEHSSQRSRGVRRSGMSSRGSFNSPLRWNFEDPLAIDYDDAIREAYHHPQFTAVAAAFDRLDEEEDERAQAQMRSFDGGEGGRNGGKNKQDRPKRVMSKAEAARLAQQREEEEEERRRAELLPLVQMLTHDHQFALPYSPIESAERRAKWLRELRQSDERSGRLLLPHNAVSLQRRGGNGNTVSAHSASGTKGAQTQSQRVFADNEEKEEGKHIDGQSQRGAGERLTHSLIDNEEREGEREDSAGGRAAALNFDGDSGLDLPENHSEGQDLFEDGLDDHFGVFEEGIDEFEREMRRVRASVAREERRKERAVQAAVANRLKPSLSTISADENSAIIDTDPLKTKLASEWKKPGVYEYRLRDKLELFDKTKVHRAFESDVRRGGWKKPTDNRMVEVGLGDYDNEGNFSFKYRAPDDSSFLHPKSAEQVKKEKEVAEAEARQRERLEKIKKVLARQSGGIAALAGKFDDLSGLVTTQQTAKANSRSVGDGADEDVDNKSVPSSRAVRDESPETDHERHVDFGGREVILSDSSDDDDDKQDEDFHLAAPSPPVELQDDEPFEL